MPKRSRKRKLKYELSYAWLEDEKRFNSEGPLPRLCFGISNGVILKEVPLTGQEYLLKVMWERTTCPRYTQCNKDCSQFAKNQSLFYTEPSGLKPAPDKLKKTVEWQETVVSQFSDLRACIARLLRGRCGENVQQLRLEGFTFGRWKTYFQTNEPTWVSVLDLSPATLMKGLERLVDIMKEVQPGFPLNLKISQWILLFLARIGMPLLSDTISTMRTLARTCADIRAHLDPNDELAEVHATPLNVFIAIVSRYFGQLDLSDFGIPSARGNSEIHYS